MSLIDGYGQKKTVSVVIPTLNEYQNIKEVFPHIPGFVDEIIVIDGNSVDGTVEEIRKFRKDAKIFIEKNLGKGIAMKVGFEKATGDLIVMMDADGSQNPKEILSLVNPLLNGYDASHGSRILPGGGSTDFTTFRRFGNKIFVTMVNLLYKSNYTDLCYGFRAFKKDVLDKMKIKTDAFEIETEQSIRIAKAKLKIKEIPSFEARRVYGVSRLNSIRDGWRILRLIITEYIWKEK